MRSCSFRRGFTPVNRGPSERRVRRRYVVMFQSFSNLFSPFGMGLRSVSTHTEPKKYISTTDINKNTQKTRRLTKVNSYDSSYAASSSHPQQTISASSGSQGTKTTYSLEEEYPSISSMIWTTCSVESSSTTLPNSRRH